MATLSKTLIENQVQSGCYLIWGIYMEEAGANSFSFPILGSKCGYIPSISLGAQIDRNSWDALWESEGHVYTHVSGIQINSESNECEIGNDTAILHPLSAVNELQVCRTLLLENTTPIIQNYGNSSISQYRLPIDSIERYTIH